MAFIIVKRWPLSRGLKNNSECMDFYQDKNVAIVEKPRNVAITERWQFVKV